MNKIAIMQPYLFPYIGYFQLIKEVNQFVFYDDVNFITRGWINRNRILINGEAKYFTIPCKDASQNRLIKEIEHALDDKKRSKLLRKMKFTYGKAPFFEDVYPLIESVFRTDSQYIADLAVASIKKSCSYLSLECNYKLSSGHFNNSTLDAADRLINICKQEKIDNYVNPIGGEELYSKEYFKENDVNLQFLQPLEHNYDQFSNEFVPWLSIIDVMMFNSPKKIRNDLINSYKLL